MFVNNLRSFNNKHICLKAVPGVSHMHDEIYIQNYLQRTDEFSRCLFIIAFADV